MAVMRAYMRGIERMQRVCEIIAMLAPVSGFPPYASGNMMVFNPSGVAVAKKHKKSTSLPIEKPKSKFAKVLMPKSVATSTAGIKTSRRMVAI